jgi:probable rRNA maturation factor
VKSDEFTSLINQTKGKLPSLPFVDIKNAILGTKYELSISFVTPKVSKQLNGAHRGKDYATNVLSFELSKTSGELILQPACVKRDAKNFDMDYPNFLAFLLIHGMLHLKGMDHSSTMEKHEARYKKMFGIVESNKRATK